MVGKRLKRAASRTPNKATGNKGSMMIVIKSKRIGPNKIDGIKIKGIVDRKMNIIIIRKNMMAGKMPNMVIGKMPIMANGRELNMMVGKKLNILADEELDMTWRQV